MTISECSSSPIFVRNNQKKSRCFENFHKMNRKTPVIEPFLIKLKSSSLRTPAQLFSCEISESLRTDLQTANFLPFWKTMKL